ncbi:MAG: LTA synthase family protein [Saprospiraceae bacterium]|nr:LTA synthase family protein [Saprospiraceae bacterium]
MEFSDAVYFPFAFRRVLRSDFSMNHDAGTLLPEFIAEYWWFFLSFTFLMGFLFYLYGKTHSDLGDYKQSPMYQSIILLISIPFIFIGMRGGLQLRPVTPHTSLTYVSSPLYAPLVTNASLGLIMSFQQQHIEEKNYLDKATLEKRVPVLHQPNSSEEFKRHNVVLIILESMGKEYIDYYNPKEEKYTPFLDSLLQESWLCEQGYANGLRSSQGVVSIAAGFPSLMEDPFVFSAYSTNNLVGIGELLKEEGYTTSFFHGGTIGTMDFDKFAPIAGFDKYHGLETFQETQNYDEQVHYDGTWGIWDRFFYDYMLDEIRTYKNPFLACFFSINSHHPYNVEKEFEQLYPKDKKLWRSVRYADYALKHFFEQAQKEDWYSNTLFVITADHIGMAQSPYYFSQSGRYAIPIAFYHPTDTSLRKQSTQRICQQLDILPSVMDYLNYPKEYFALGQSVFDTTITKSYNYIYDAEVYNITGEQYLLRFDGEKSIGIYDYQKDYTLTHNLIHNLEYEPDIAEAKEDLEAQLKAMIQAHHSILLNNRMNIYDE